MRICKKKKKIKKRGQRDAEEVGREGRRLVGEGVVPGRRRNGVGTCVCEGRIEMFLKVSGQSHLTGVLSNENHRILLEV